MAKIVHTIKLFGIPHQICRTSGGYYLQHTPDPAVPSFKVTQPTEARPRRAFCALLRAYRHIGRCICTVRRDLLRAQAR